VLAISNRELLTVDTTNRDAPTLRHALELAYPVDRVLPIGDWLVQFSGTDVRVSAAANPGMTLRQYALDDLPVLGVTAASNKVHVLQGRSAPGSSGVIWILAETGGHATTLTNRGFLQHTVLEAAHLPDLTVAGTAHTETTNEFWVSEAKSLWPKPGLIVWSLNGQQRSWWNPNWPTILRPSVNSGVIQIMPVFDAPIPFGPMFLQFAPVDWFQPAILPSLLVAADVNHAGSPRFLSETPLALSASVVSDTFAADGLVFFSHARQESEIVSTNYNVYTNQVWVTATNHLLKTNIISVPDSVTNVVQEERISRQLQSQVFTNVIPVYRRWNRHWLDVVDYQQDAATPAVREPASLPGLLQGVSHRGAVLYSLATTFHNESPTLAASKLSTLAYDGIAAHLISTLTVSTNSNTGSAQVVVNPNGVVVVARDSWIEGHPRRLECWRLDERGQLGLLGALDRPTHSDSLLLLADLAVLRTETGFELVDLAQPTAPIALPVNANLNCLWADLWRVRGDREAGVWVPAGELGSLLLWRR